MEKRRKRFRKGRLLLIAMLLLLAGTAVLKAPAWIQQFRDTLAAATADYGERLGGAEPAVRHVKQAESFHGEHVKARSAVDESLGHGNVADGGRAEHWERARAGSGSGVIP